MLKRIGEWFSRQWDKIPENKQDKIKVSFWWFFTIIAAVNAFSIIIYFDNPDHAPYVGAMITVFAYFSFTRLKSTEDGYARDFETRLTELHSKNYYYEILAVKRDIAIESYNRELEDFKLNRKIDEILESKRSRPPSMFMTSESLSGRNRKSPPRQPGIINSPIMRIGNYKQLNSEYLKSIKRHRAYADRYATMEAIGIIYGASISVFGADFIRMWNG